MKKYTPYGKYILVAKPKVAEETKTGKLILTSEKKSFFRAKIIGTSEEYLDSDIEVYGPIVDCEALINIYCETIIDEDDENYYILVRKEDILALIDDEREENVNS